MPARSHAIQCNGVIIFSDVDHLYAKNPTVKNDIKKSYVETLGDANISL